jgi:hypothetical protein
VLYAGWVGLGQYLLGRLFDRRPARAALALYWGIAILLAGAGGWLSDLFPHWVAASMMAACLALAVASLRLGGTAASAAAAVDHG